MRIVHSRLLDAWLVVRGPHYTPISGTFPTREAAQEWLQSRREAR